MYWPWLRSAATSKGQIFIAVMPSSSSDCRQFVGVVQEALQVLVRALRVAQAPVRRGLVRLLRMYW